LQNRKHKATFAMKGRKNAPFIWGFFFKI